MCNHVHVTRGQCLLEYDHEEAHFYREDALAARLNESYLRKRVEELEQENRGFKHIIETARKYEVEVQDELRCRGTDITFLRRKIEGLEIQLRESQESLSISFEMSDKGPSR